MNEFECILRSPCSMVHKDSDGHAVRVELVADAGISRTGLTSWFVCIRRIAWFRFLVEEIKGQSWKLKKNVQIVKKTGPCNIFETIFADTSRLLKSQGIVSDQIPNPGWSVGHGICHNGKTIPRKANLLAKIVQKLT